MDTSVQIVLIIAVAVVVVLFLLRRRIKDFMIKTGILEARVITHKPREEAVRSEPDQPGEIRQSVDDLGRISHSGPEVKGSGKIDQRASGGIIEDSPPRIS